MKPQDAAALARLLAAKDALQAEARKRATCLFRTTFPDDGPLRRELYVPHVEFMKAGAVHRERAFIAANRIGKTRAAGYEVSCHMTGLYPPWWEGARITHPNRWWFAGDTMQTTRDIVQVELMGPHDGVPRGEWAGMIPPHLVHHTTRRTGGVANCLEYVYVKHFDASGKQDGISSGQFKSYDQGRRSFQGVDLDGGAWIDEEPPDTVEEQTGDIYTEILLRTMVGGGLVIGTFTPLRGLTPFIQRYLEDAVTPDRMGGEMPAMQYFWPEGQPGEDAA